MVGILEVRNWQLAVWLIIAISIIIKTYYYSKIKYNKSIIEFTMDYFHWAPKMFIKNCGADDNRKKYMKINNKCMLMLWLMLALQLILLFVADKAKTGS
jgi:hypothetical protein